MVMPGMQIISELLVRFMNKDLSDMEVQKLMTKLHIKGLKGPDKSGYLTDEERLKLFEGLKNL